MRGDNHELRVPLTGSRLYFPSLAQPICKGSSRSHIYIVCVISTPGVMATLAGYEHPGLAVRSLPICLCPFPASGSFSCLLGTIRGMEASHFKEEKAGLGGFWWAVARAWQFLAHSCNSPHTESSFATVVLACLRPGPGPQCPLGNLNR